MINAIDINSIDDTTYLNEECNKLRVLQNIKKINIFIGENNSGKSRMLRSLLKNDSLLILSNSFVDNDKKNNISNYYNYISSSVRNFNEYSKDIKIELPELYDLNEVDSYVKVYDYIHNLVIDRDKLTSTARSSYDSIIQYLKNIKDLLSKTNVGNSGPKMLNKMDITYIPILRGIECFDRSFVLKKSKELASITMNELQREALEEYKTNAKHIYQNKITKSYKITKPNTIFTAENLYDEITYKLLGEESGRKFIKDFQEFISDEFYDGKEFTIIPQMQEGVLNVKIGEETERALYDLGDGIKQIITILYKIFEKKDEEAIFLIEEPEINLHPGYQRKLIEIFQSSRFSKHQYFITTHSNHLIDSCFDYSDISIFKFINVNKSNNIFQVINTSPNDIEMLQLLGVNNSSVFMSNCTIWVEGISDKILISKYLDVYLKYKSNNKYKEDINYSFVEYGGNNITHWAFIPEDSIETINASGITNRSFIIYDNDNDSDKKKKRKENLKKIFGKNCCELTVREIENTISRNVLEKTLFPDGNINIKKKFKNSDYANKKTYMGNFIDAHYELKRKYSSSKGTGTIINKLEFARRISQNIESIEDLSSQAINLCRKIEKFIEESNNI